MRINFILIILAMIIFNQYSQACSPLENNRFNSPSYIDRGYKVKKDINLFLGPYYYKDLFIDLITLYYALPKQIDSQQQNECKRKISKIEEVNDNPKKIQKITEF